MSVTDRFGAWLDGELTRWRVWAPDHDELAVELFGPDGRRPVGSVPMRPAGDGWFEAALEGGGPGTLYKYRVDGEGPYPDPASRAQPFGVHGPSAVDGTDFPWTDQGWRGIALEDLVLYEVHVGTATREGTFAALIPRLAALRELGVTALEIMPVASFPGTRNWGYDGVDLYAPAAVYGGPAGLRKLVDAAHAAGLGVVVDAVYNHLGPDGNYLRAFSSGYFTARYKTPWGDALHLEGPEAAPVRAFLRANAAMWVRDYHVDGLRLDAAHALFDASEPHILTEVARHARDAGAGRHVLVMAEDERNEAALVTPEVRGGRGLDAVWADDFHHQMRRAFAGDRQGYYADYTGSAEDLATTLREGWFYRGQHSAHLGHARGTPAGEVAPPRLIHCIQNHDQVGNRALGDRLGAGVTPAAFRAMSALLLVSPFTPLLFMGQEWNASTPFLYFTDHGEELGRAVTRGRREEFRAFADFAGQEVPDPQAAATFERSRLDWDERLMPEHRGTLAWYAALLRLRASHPCLRERARGTFDARALGPQAVLLERRAGAACVRVVVTLSGRLEWEPDGGPWRVLAFSEDSRFGGTAATAPLVGSTVQLDGPAALLIERT